MLKASKQRLIAERYLVANKKKENKERIRSQKIYSKRFYKELVEEIKGVSKDGGTFLRKSTGRLDRYLPGALDIIETKLIEKGFTVKREQSFNWENWEIQW